MARVLVVEDDPDTCEALGELIQESGYEPIVAVNGIKGLDAVRTHSPDAIILDLAIPFMDGLRVLRILKADRQFRGTPVVVVTGLADPALHQQARDAGACQVIAKPWGADQIQAALRVVLGDRPRA